MIRGLAIKLVGKKRREEIKKEKIKRVLISGGKIGDIIVKTPMLEALSKLNKDVKIDITVVKGAKCLVENIPYINKVIEIDEKPTRNKIIKGYRELIGALKNRKKYDLYFDFTNNCRFIHTLSLKLMSPKYLIGRYRLEKFGIKKDELTLFDSYIDVKGDAHAVDINMDYLKPLGLHKESRKYRLYLGKNEKKYENYFEKNKMNIVLNHRASSEPRSLTLEQLKDLSLKLINLNKDIVVYIISVPSEYEILKDLVSKLDKENIKLLPKTEEIGEAAGLLKYSDMLVSVDTGLIHIASVYNIPIVGIYPLTENSAKLFEPKSERYEIVRGTKSGYTIEGVSLDKVVESVNKILEESVYDKKCVV
ncbi:MAG: glycosyltransferase family 9 protein [Cetobacterium sp.]|uniref:glycosyltransferase family 9 protein n=1 Tax=Cetobacterium sp. TaxID=2071632 RepID=UPI003F3EAC32